jgi:superfamily II DNA or RNA helicase
MDNNSLKLEYHNPEYMEDAFQIEVPNLATKKLRVWQRDAFNKLKNARFALCAAFCGSGKSILQVALAVHDIVRCGYKQKQLIVVPQQHIHKTFVGEGNIEYIPLLVNGKKYEWKVIHNFCDADDEILKGLKKWLLTSPAKLSKNYRDKIIAGVNAVASHQALTRVWSKLTEAEKQIAIKNLTLRIDEAHHIKGVFEEEEEELTDAQKIAVKSESTYLGEISRFIFNNGKTSKLHFTTATFYRGDRSNILFPAVEEKFTTYYLDWIKHFKTLGIERFDLQYEEYNGDPIKDIAYRIAQEPNEKHLVIIPSTTHKWRLNGDSELQKLLKEIYKLVPKERVLDLVTKNTQKKNKKLLLAEPKTAENESKFDVIVTCMLGLEGTDWCPCSRLHNAAPGSSITLAVQIMGRPFRQFRGKTQVRMYSYIKQFVQPKAGMTKQDLLNDRTNALLTCIQIDEMCRPIILPILPSKKNGSKNSQGITLRDIFGNKYEDVKRTLIEELECLENKTKEDINLVIEDILNEQGIKKHRKAVKAGLQALTIRLLADELKDLGVDVEFIRREGFAKILEKYELKKTFFFGGYGKKDWGIIRGILKRRCEEMVEAYKKMQAEGKL